MSLETRRKNTGGGFALEPLLGPYEEFWLKSGEMSTWDFLPLKNK